MNTAGLRTGRAYSKVVRAAAQLKRYVVDKIIHGWRLIRNPIFHA